MSIYESSITNPKKQLEFYKDLSEQLQKENEKLNHYKLLYQKVKDRNDKAVEYVENYNVFKEFSFPLMKRDEENQVKSSIDYGFQTSIKKSLLEILKGNNVESEK